MRTGVTKGCVCSGRRIDITLPIVRGKEYGECGVVGYDEAVLC